MTDDFAGSPPKLPSTPIALSETGRVEAFSDGVLAIVITLLVLDLRPPEDRGHLLHGLLAQWPGYLAYLASFGYAGVIWVNHHQLFNRIEVVDVGLLWRNLGLLLATSVLPFPAAVLASAFKDGTHADQSVAVIFYCLIATLMAGGWLMIFRHLVSHPHLVDARTPATFFREERARSLLGIALYIAAAALSIWQPLAGLVLAAVLPIFYGLTSGGWTKHRKGATAT